MKRLLPTLNIRRKAGIGILAYLLAVGVLGVISFYSLGQIERKIRLVEIADDLKSDILEIRRYEKNFLLYARQADLAENRAYTAKGLATLDNAAPLAGQLNSATMVNTLRKGLRDYGRLMDDVALLAGNVSRLEDDPAVARLRAQGKDLLDGARALVAFERERILAIHKRLMANLLLSVVALVILGAALIYFVNRYVVAPLRLIERATGRIAKGVFYRVEVRRSGDELQSVMEAFNHMVEELERRQDQLVQAQKLSSIGTLASGIAHQLNNPLNNISTSLQILKDDLGDDLPELPRKMLTNIGQETFRARDIVKGLLEFSRQEDFHLGETVLKTVVERSVGLVSSQVPGNVTVSVDVAEDVVLPMDSQRMQEALINLLMNAIQAMEGQPGRIDISMAESDEPDQVVLAVADTGPGIPEADLRRVFDPFYSTKEVGSGTGLGLYVVYGIVKRHRGAIRVESREGEGTTFFITLPVTPPPEGE